MPRSPLTDEQKRIATSTNRLTFVEAVPGSGKTTVATERFGVLRYGALDSDSSGVIAVSFARSAAAELRARVLLRWGRRALAAPNAVTTMDRLHRAVVEFLLLTGRVIWPGGIVKPRLIDSWARQRGASRISTHGRLTQRWELTLHGDALALAFRAVDSPCWGMPHAQRMQYAASLKEGVCTHDEIRQVVGLALGRPDLRSAVDGYLARNVAHLIVDEAFDLNGLDALLVQRAIESGVGVTLVGDPWQALYEWRGARPDMVHALLRKHGFETLPLHDSHRFKEDATVRLAADLRAGQGVQLEQSSGGADVVLASEWDHLLLAGPEVIPISFGQLDCQTDAAIVLLLDEVVQARLRIRALNVPEALRCLRRLPETIDLQPILALLRDPSTALEDVLEALRSATKVAGTRRPALPPPRRPLRLARLASLRDWVTVERSYIAGQSFHQAKGRQWRHVDVALDAQARSILDSGLVNTVEEHRKLYVGLTRASHSTRLRAV